MQTQIVKMINDFEHGRLSRRQLIAHLTGMFAASLGATLALADQQPGPAAAHPAESAPTFDATDLNHVALSVTDVRRSQKWYQKHFACFAAKISQTVEHDRETISHSAQAIAVIPRIGDT